MAEKNFWGWLNIGRDGQPIEGESGGGQRYAAVEHSKPSLFWGVVYWAFLSVSIAVLFVPFILATAVLSIGDWCDSVLDYLDEKRG